VRAPDLAFIAENRMPPRGVPGWVCVVPDLVAEVVSSGDRTTEVGEKVRMWLDAGVRLVLPEGTMLDGGDVVPGFSCPISEIFAS